MGQYPNQSDSTLTAPFPPEDYRWCGKLEDKNSGSEIKKVSYGCENKKCEFYAVCESNGKNEARCVCPHSCIKESPFHYVFGRILPEQHMGNCRAVYSEDTAFRNVEISCFSQRALEFSTQRSRHSGSFFWFPHI
ncbi:hypothetical protein CEXT_221051 [Caerostris extrusa]|uniref:Uncharacterized protein n=1 Tax=Caerostris extrusa TaxID=172846 RepID=A0AAV4N5T5_CAEEX|nr:hypothetical protein CEXT_221051 [Caerostris extrusa]